MHTVRDPRYYGGVPVNADKIILCGIIIVIDAYCTEILAAHDQYFSVSMANPIISSAESLGLSTSDLREIEVIEITV